jgi:hypothetical protein
MVERFGVEGTSDDESDREDPQHSRYNICRMPWMSKEATNWKRTIDKVRNLSKYQGKEVPSLRGAHERQRTISGKISTRSYIPGIAGKLEYPGPGF